MLKGKIIINVTLIYLNVLVKVFLSVLNCMGVCDTGKSHKCTKLKGKIIRYVTLIYLNVLVKYSFQF